MATTAAPVDLLNHHPIYTRSPGPPGPFSPRPNYPGEYRDRVAPGSTTRTITTTTITTTVQSLGERERPPPPPPASILIPAALMTVTLQQPRGRGGELQEHQRITNL